MTDGGGPAGPPVRGVAVSGVAVEDGATGLTVTVSDEQADQAIDADHLAQLAAVVVAGEGGDGELHLAFVDEVTMAGLNEQHMGHPGSTDVLAFPIDAAEGTEAPGPAEIPRLLGDVVVCPAVAARQAEAAGGSTRDELELLVVHGILHVLGWDHATPAEREAMQVRERRYLEKRPSGPQAGGGEQVSR